MWPEYVAKSVTDIRTVHAHAKAQGWDNWWRVSDKKGYTSEFIMIVIPVQ